MMYHVLDSGGKTGGVDVSEGSGAAVEKWLRTVAQESRHVLCNLCHLLLAADALKVHAILNTHDKVLSVLRHMETVTNFQEFVQCFGEFGTNMVELAQTSGERQNELLNETCSLKLSCTRAILEKGTMMLLTSSKTLLRHPECNSAQRTRDSVYEMLKASLAQLRNNVEGGSSAGVVNMWGGIDRVQSVSGPLSIQQMMTEIQGLLADCLLTETLSQWTLNKLLSLVESIKSEFNLLLAGGDSASPTQAGGGATGAETTAPPTTAGLMSIPAEEVSHITTALDQLQITCQTFTPQLLLSASMPVASSGGKDSANCCSSSSASPLDSFGSNLWLHFSDLTKSLHSTVLNQCAHCLTTQNDMLHSLQLFQQAARGQGHDNNTDSNLKSGSKQGQLSSGAGGGNSNSIHAVEAEAFRFQQLYADQYQNLCRLLYHVCESERLRVLCEHCGVCIRHFSHQLVLSAQTAALYPSSKIANENLAVFTDTWNCQMQEFSTLMKDISDVITGKSDGGPNQMGGLLGTVASPDTFGGKTAAAYATASWETGRAGVGVGVGLGRVGLKVKRVGCLLENEVDLLHSSLEAEGVLSPSSPTQLITCSDVMKRCRNLCSMAFALYLFTRKSGPLHTPSDVLTQVQFFAQESLKIHSLVNENSQQLLSLASGGQIGSISAGGQGQGGQVVDSVSELKTLLTEIPSHIKQLLLLCGGGPETQGGGGGVNMARNPTNRVEISFEEVNLVLWNLLSLIRYYFQAIYLTYLPDYSLNVAVGASSSVAPVLFQQHYPPAGAPLTQQLPPFNQQQGSTAGGGTSYIPQQQQQTQAGATAAFAMQQQVGGVGGHVAAAVSNSSPVLHSNLQPGQPQHNSPQFRSQMMGGVSGTAGNTVSSNHNVPLGGGGSNSTSSPPNSFSSSPNQQNNQLIAPISGAINPNFMSLQSNGAGSLKKTSSLFDRM